MCMLVCVFLCTCVHICVELARESRTHQQHAQCSFSRPLEPSQTVLGASFLGSHGPGHPLGLAWAVSGFLGEPRTCHPTSHSILNLLRSQQDTQLPDPSSLVQEAGFFQREKQPSFHLQGGRYLAGEGCKAFPSSLDIFNEKNNEKDALWGKFWRWKTAVALLKPSSLGASGLLALLDCISFLPICL